MFTVLPIPGVKAIWLGTYYDHVTHIVIVPLSSTGAFSVYNSSGSTDVTVDVAGYVG